MNNPKRDKRAYKIYLEDLQRRFKENPDMMMDDGTPISHELKMVEMLITDINFVIEMQEKSEV
jgi:hypothetical protein